jgi:hypothetical protein
VPEGRPGVRIEPLTVTTPANTPASSPQVTAFDIGTVSVLTVTLVVPPGHKGLTGWRLEWQGTTLVPWDDPTGWVVVDDHRLEWPLDIVVTGPVTVRTYNVDVRYPHTHHAWAMVADWPPVGGGGEVAPSGPTLMVPVA